MSEPLCRSAPKPSNADCLFEPNINYDGFDDIHIDRSRCLFLLSARRLGSSKANILNITASTLSRCVTFRKTEASVNLVSRIT